jgi:hypothetical protein
MGMDLVVMAEVVDIMGLFHPAVALGPGGAGGLVRRLLYLVYWKMALE